MCTACCHGAKIIDCRESPQLGENGPVAPVGLAREGKLDILAAAWLLSCYLGIGLAAELPPVKLLSRHVGTSLAAQPLCCLPNGSSLVA